MEQHEKNGNGCKKLKGACPPLNTSQPAKQASTPPSHLSGFKVCLCNRRITPILKRAYAFFQIQLNRRSTFAALSVPIFRYSLRPFGEKPGLLFPQQRLLIDPMKVEPRLMESRLAWTPCYCEQFSWPKK